MHNRIVREKCTGDVVLLLNNDVVLTGSWSLDEWASWANQPKVSSVGILLRYPYGVIQHGGTSVSCGGEAHLVCPAHYEQDAWLTSLNREVICNTFAACMISRAAFETVGPLRPSDFPNGYGDVFYCYDAVRRGYHNLYLGGIEGIHLESASRGKTYEYWEEVELEREFGDLLGRFVREDIGINRVPISETDWKRISLRVLKIRLGQGGAIAQSIRHVLKRIRDFWRRRQFDLPKTPQPVEVAP
jgi:hypothetical protein